MQFPLLVLASIQDLTLGGTSTEGTDTVSEALTATGEVVTRDVSIFELLLSGGWYIMLPLAIMSFIAIFIFFERSMAIRKAAKEVDAAGKTKFRARNGRNYPK